MTNDTTADAARMRAFLEALLVDINPTKPAGDAGVELGPAYRLDHNDARNLSHRIRQILNAGAGEAAEARLRETACPRCSSPGSMTFHNGGGVCPLVRTDDEVPLCRPEDT
jgi:hypothetical protein